MFCRTGLSLRLRPLKRDIFPEDPIFFGNILVISIQFSILYNRPYLILRSWVNFYPESILRRLDRRTMAYIHRIHFCAGWQSVCKYWVDVGKVIDIASSVAYKRQNNIKILPVTRQTAIRRLQYERCC